MEVKDLYLYKRIAGSNRTISLRELEYLKPYTVKNLFYVVKNSTDENDLLYRLNYITKGIVKLAKNKGTKISYVISTEKLGNIILKVKLKQEVANESL